MGGVAPHLIAIAATGVRGDAGECLGEFGRTARQSVQLRAERAELRYLDVKPLAHARGV
jgi:hypothetical protein